MNDLDMTSEAQRHSIFYVKAEVWVRLKWLDVVGFYFLLRSTEVALMAMFLVNICAPLAIGV